MGNLIRGAKVGSIVRTMSHQQYFYVHNICGDTMYMSGIATHGHVFRKTDWYEVNEVVPQEKEHIFYDLIIQHHCNFDLNKGVQGRRRFF